MYTKEDCVKIISDYDRLINELERVLKLFDSFSVNITYINLIGDDIHVSYDDCCMGVWGRSNVTIPFNLLYATTDVIKDYLKKMREENEQRADEQYKKETKEKELKQLRELSEKYKDIAHE